MEQKDPIIAEAQLREAEFKRTALSTGQILLINSPGMRTIKTAVAILICFLFDYFRGASNYYDAAIAAVVCMQSTVRSGWRNGASRLFGTVFAGVYAILFFAIFHDWLGIEFYSVPFLIISALFGIPLMHMLVRMHQSGAVSNGIIVYILLCTTTNGVSEPLMYAANRVINTIFGVGVGVWINWSPTLNRIGRKYDADRQRAYVDYDLVKETIGRIEKERRKEENDTEG